MSRLRDFVVSFTELVEQEPAEPVLLDKGRVLLAALIATDDWLPDGYAVPDAQYYRQYLLHCDVKQRFSVVSFVWGPGQKTPVHDHRVWGLVGVLRGKEISTPYRRTADGHLEPGQPARLGVGQIEPVSPALGDIHRVENALADRASVSIHVYGANIGAVPRATYDPASGAEKRFVSGYSNDAVPNLWHAR